MSKLRPAGAFPERKYHSWIFENAYGLKDDDFYQVLHFTKMMCAAMPVMEEVKELRNIVHEYVTTVIDNEVDIDVELEEEVGVEKTYDGNVIHLNFNSKTKGSA